METGNEEGEKGEDRRQGRVGRRRMRGKGRGRGKRHKKLERRRERG